MRWDKHWKVNSYGNLAAFKKSPKGRRKKLNDSRPFSNDWCEDWNQTATNFFHTLLYFYKKEKALNVHAEQRTHIYISKKKKMNDLLLS